MNPRTIPPLRLDPEENISGSLQEALDTAVEDELPEEDRMLRMEGAVLAAIAASSETSARDARVAPPERTSSSERTSPSRPTAWRPPARTRVRFASAKIGLAALVGMGAAWSSVTGYRAYQVAIERASKEPSAATQQSTATRGHPTGPATKHEIADDEATTTTVPPRSPSPQSLSREPPRSAGPTSAPVEGFALASPNTRGVAAAEEPSIGARPEPPPKIAPIEPAKRATSTPPSSLPTPAPSLPSTADNAPPEAPKEPPAMTAEQRELEEDLLERAARALRSDPETALAVAETHRRSFAGGRLAQEREVIAIKALAKLKRLEQARARAAMFLAQHPESPYAKDVSALVAGAAGR